MKLTQGGGFPGLPLLLSHPPLQVYFGLKPMPYRLVHRKCPSLSDTDPQNTLLRDALDPSRRAARL